MEKKIFEAPYLKVVNVKNDIIATSTGVTAGSTLGNEIDSENDGTYTDYGWDNQF